MQSRPPVSLIGAACRLPGAADEREFALLLDNGGFSIRDLSDGRWVPDGLLHPNAKLPGYAYTFRGGYLDNPFDFDLSVFGMSPREAVQVDPQQRLLAEVVWEALEDARIPPAALAGSEVGVYIGVSALDHANLFAGDPGAIESHFMTGNTLSVVANRISYLFDLKGPSFVVDTACSSSLVAVDRAVADIVSGRVDTAIVGGVNMLLSPASFVGFSRAAMLSPTGACRPFSAKGDGYVRAEGAVVFVLRRSDLVDGGSVRAFIRATAVNSDGRTSGIALPGIGGQTSLLERAYREAGISPDALSFIEAHGTGTAVGDPVEATAIGEVLGRKRDKPLPIGSVKSNIGHLEPASGVAGMMKALIALENRRLPATLHLDELNPSIDFAALNLLPASRPIDLEGGGKPLHCGVSSFGFGGTNAHVVMSSAPSQPFETIPAMSAQPKMLLLSAACQSALRDVAASHSKLLQQGVAPARLANAVARGRQRMRHRLVLPLGDGFPMAKTLENFAANRRVTGAATGVASAGETKMAFVFSGNGAQWAGMGRHAYRGNEDFAGHFQRIDAAFRRAGAESLEALLFAEDLKDRLGAAGCAQPLLFAIQVAIAAGLADRGFRPDMIVGHSVGELAAAHIAGLIDVDTAVRLLLARARSQEAVRGEGAMAVIATGREAAMAMIDATGDEELSIAADNSSSSVTVSGSAEAIDRLLKQARQARIAGRKLDIDYPYHSALLDRIEADFRDAAGQPGARAATLPMVSTVTGRIIDDPLLLDADYWWRNIRSEVLFRQAIATCVEAGCGLFVEVGPRPILTGAIAAIAEEVGHPATVLVTLAERDDDISRGGDAEGDIIDLIAARLLAAGYDADMQSGRHWVDRSLDLPLYPWQRRTYRYQSTSAAVDVGGVRPRRPLLGARLAQGAPEWRSIVDAERLPFLADHVVGGEVVVPATALAEMALAAAQELAPGQPVAIRDFDIVQAMVIPDGGQREVSVRHSAPSSGIEVYHRQRFAEDEWTLCARGQIVPAAAVDVPPEPGHGRIVTDIDKVYATAAASGIHYGPHFRLAERLWTDDDTLIGIALQPPLADGGADHAAFVIHPASLDAALHGLFDQLALDERGQTAWVPIRFERLSVWNAGARVTGAILDIVRDTDVSKIVNIWLTDAGGQVVARLDRALLRPVRLNHAGRATVFHHMAQLTEPGMRFAESDAGSALCSVAIADQSEGRLLLRAHMWASLRRELARRADADGIFRPETLAVVRETPGFARFLALRAELQSAGIVVEGENGGLQIAANADLDDPDAILLTFAQEFPASVADLTLSAHAAAEMAAVLNGEAVRGPRAAILEQHKRDNLLGAPLRQALRDIVHARTAASAPRVLHVALMAGAGEALLPDLLEAAEADAIRLSLAVGGAEHVEMMSRGRAGMAAPHIIDLTSDRAPADVGLALVMVDPTTAPPGDAALAALAERLRPEGLIVLAVAEPDTLALFQTGAIESGDPLGSLRSRLPSCGLVERHLALNASGECGLIIAQKIGRQLLSGSSRRFAIHQLGGEEPLADALRDRPGLAIGDAADLPDEGRAGDVVLLSRASPAAADIAATVSALRDALVAQREAGARQPCWIICPPASAPVRAALGGFARVAMNEFAERALRWIECDDTLGTDAAAIEIAGLLEDPGDERLTAIDSQGVRLPRLREAMPSSQSAEEAGCRLQLDFPRPGMLEHFSWNAADRVPPAADEIEIEIAGAALNFRDVMLAMGLLNDDVVDDGLTGPVLGFECAGTVVATGPGASRYKIGDLVVGFGRRSFATHLCAPEDLFFPLMPGTTPEASAANPVAFFTAWYSLVECARLRDGETVLIHGGAGGVGLAAIQIAKSLGARVIATVSSDDKQAIARLFGADHVLNSRTLDFADEVRDRFGGADVVLNSLFGEAMRAGLRCLKPRGRFIELGKRDYVGNTQIGVRPFRRNLVYYGVDVDQILADNREIAARGMAEILAGFETGRYLPLPCSIFEATEVNRAFRMMQAAGHIGKIVIRPPSLARPVQPVGGDFAPGEKVQLIVGGTRGFGLATALWLADRGAARIVVASRSGTIEEGRFAEVEAARAKGCMFATEAVDVADEASVRALIDRVVAAHGPIGAVYHTAAVLADGLIDDLDPDALARVLAPKVDGARHLDRATRGQPLDRFVLYSSASALFGNPGQASYCAANGYLEGLARQRRAEGLPALAVQWGAIADVGLLADRQATIRSLERVSGVAAMQSAVALQRLGQLLATADQLSDPVVVCAEVAADSALTALPLLTSPTFAGSAFASGNGAGESAQDLAAMIAGKPDIEAQRLLADLLAGEVAQILRLPVADIDLNSSIDGLGMDSLMALELRMSIETRYGVELPVMAISSGTNIRALAHRLLQIVRENPGDGDGRDGFSAEEIDLIAMHSDRSAGAAETDVVDADWPTVAPRDASNVRGR